MIFKNTEGDNVKFVNLTPHKVVVRCEDGDRIFKPSGTVARLVMKQRLVDVIDGVSIFADEDYTIKNLPSSKHGVIYITSGIIAKLVKRKDVVSPNTSPSSVITNSYRQIEAVKSLITYGE